MQQRAKAAVRVLRLSREATMQLETAATWAGSFVYAGLVHGPSLEMPANFSIGRSVARDEIDVHCRRTSILEVEISATYVGVVRPRDVRTSRRCRAESSVDVVDDPWRRTLSSDRRR